MTDFFFNPDNPKKSFDVFKDKNKKDTVAISYKNKKEVLQTIKKIEKLYREGKITHSRASKISMIMRVRLRIIKDRNPKIDKGRLALSNKYSDFLKIRTKLSTEKERKEFKFNEKMEY
tara:strand:+ start:534 stop:887 length:354 start_codon:yes stop_codon:yes gene_type:complete